MKNLVSLLSLTLFIVSCNKNENKEISSEELETIIYKVESFHSITNNSFVDIEISESVPKDEIHFIASKKKIENITREVNNGNLIIDSSRKNFNFGNDTNITAKINSNSLSSFTINGAGNIKSHITQIATNIKTDISGAGNLELLISNESVTNDISGVGNVDLIGKTKTLKTEISGAGNLNATKLSAVESWNSISGVGNASVNVSYKLHAEISGVGNVEYKGNPKEIIKEISGLGSVNEQ